jgi:hypothetical protein
MLTATEKFAAVARALERLGEIEFMDTDADCTRLVMKRAHACAFCGAQHFVFINREGRTRCAVCDEQQRFEVGASRGEERTR